MCVFIGRGVTYQAKHRGSTRVLFRFQYQTYLLMNTGIICDNRLIIFFIKILSGNSRILCYYLFNNIQTLPLVSRGFYPTRELCRNFGFVEKKMWCRTHLGVNITLQWRHNGRNGVSNHQPHDCLLNRLFKQMYFVHGHGHITGPLCGDPNPIRQSYSTLFTYIKADSRFAPNQWEILLQSNVVSHWLGANQESALYMLGILLTHASVN